jgi:predicted GIY-YIG superfamily endonuclease
MINIHCLYFHLNPQTNNVFYIGIGTLKRAYNFKDRNNHYKGYIKKYGTPIVKIVQENLTLEEASKLEKQLILEYGRIGYEENGILVNKSLGGEYTHYGVKHSLETRIKISKHTKGKTKIHPLSRNLKIKEWRKNNIELNNKISEGRKKSILQYDKQGNLIKEWNSIQDAQNYYSKVGDGIGACCRKKQKTAYEYIWKYKN